MLLPAICIGRTGSDDHCKKLRADPESDFTLLRVLICKATVKQLATPHMEIKMKIANSYLIFGLV
jgi:hypothetical protein